MVTIRKFVSEQRIWLVCIFGFLAMSLIKPALLSTQNLKGIMNAVVPYGIVALGLAMTLIAGEIDISIGSVMAFASVALAVGLETLGLPVAILLVLGGVVVIGMVNGFLIAYRDLPAFLISVATMVVVRGLALWISGQRPIGIRSKFVTNLGRAAIGDVVPVLFLFLLFAAFLLEFFLRRTQTGRNLYAVGGASDVSQAYGLDVRKYKFWALTFCSFMAGVGGLLLAVRMSSGSPSVAQDAMPAILPMIVIGGTSISGGKGGMIKTLSGILLINLIFNIMSMFNIYVNIQSLVKGVILLSIVVADKYIEKKDRKI